MMIIPSPAPAEDDVDAAAVAETLLVVRGSDVDTYEDGRRARNTDDEDEEAVAGEEEEEEEAPPFEDCCC